MKGSYANFKPHSVEPKVNQRIQYRDFYFAGNLIQEKYPETKKRLIHALNDNSKFLEGKKNMLPRKICD